MLLPILLMIIVTLMMHLHRKGVTWVDQPVTFRYRFRKVAPIIFGRF